jgi:metal transporter CNNM
MVPIPSSKQNSARLLYILLSVATQYVPNSLRTIGLFDEPVHDDGLRYLAKREKELPQKEQIIFGVLVPVLVLLSGLFAGLTLGYMSLDETQVRVYILVSPRLTTDIRCHIVECTQYQWNSVSRFFWLPPRIYWCDRQQREYANKIKPIRENGHLLLVTLLLCNMIVNESLPIIADPLLGGGVQSVAVSTTLIVM